MTMESLKQKAKDETIFQLDLIKQKMNDRILTCKSRSSAMEESDFIETEEGEKQYNALLERWEIAEESRSMIDQIITLLKMM